MNYIVSLPTKTDLRIDSTQLAAHLKSQWQKSYTERGDVIRLISAREVTRAEREAYEEG
ncbi:MAG: hypothetical protein LDL41_01630 [Coleofasciculus sp. S288]|nr:hypothetical protein [Coleofasciculus sp. S288]